MESTSMRSAATILLLFSAGCSGESIYVYECEGGPSDGAADSTVDVLDAAKDSPGDSPSDAAPDSTCEGAGFTIGAGNCASGTENCDGGDVCCSTLEFDKSCFLRRTDHTCKPPGSCPTALQPFCGGNATVRLCDGPFDCTEPGFDRCCSFAIRCSLSTLTMCASAAMVAAADASCP